MTLERQPLDQDSGSSQHLLTVTRSRFCKLYFALRLCPPGSGTHLLPFSTLFILLSPSILLGSSCSSSNPENLFCPRALHVPSLCHLECSSPLLHLFHAPYLEIPSHVYCCSFSEKHLLIAAGTIRLYCIIYCVLSTSFSRVSAQFCERACRLV